MRLTFDRLWLVIAIALPALVALIVPLPAVDLAYQVRAGDEMLRSGALPVADTWTFTVAGTAWLDQQWLAQLIVALGHRVGGWELLAVLRAALVAATTGVLVAVAMARGAGSRLASILALAAFAIAAPALALRPQLFGVLLFVVLLWLVTARERHPRAFLAAPLVIVLWANLHGSFILGPALLGFAWLDDVAAGRPARTSFLVLAAGLLATLVNPYVAGAWTYAAGIGANPAITGQVSEWQRTSPLRMPGPMFYLSVIVSGVLMVRARSRVRWPEWVLALAFVAIGAWAERGVAWWAFVMVYLLAGALAGTAADRHSRVARASLVNGITAAVLIVLIVAALPWWRPADPLTGRAGLLTYAPSGLAAALDRIAAPGGRVVVPQTWGSWFEWAVPGNRYLIDSRFELFPPDVWNDYLAVADGGDGAAAVLDRRAADIVVVAAGAPAPAGAWSRAYEDGDGAVLVREH
jgi:hypothetical protein